MERAYHIWHSPTLGRSMELLVFGSGGARVIVFPTRDGRFYDYENWGLVTAASEKVEAGHLQLFCVDSVDRESLYADWALPQDRLQRHLEYEAYILNEVLPFTETLNPDPFVIAHGCSLGAYHAMNIGLRHPDLFGKIVAFSGRYDLTLPVGAFRDLFDGWYSEELYLNLPSHFIPNIEDEALLEKLRKLEITFAVGHADVYLANNVEFSEALLRKNIPHNFYIWDGEAHRARSWREMVRLYL